MANLKLSSMPTIRRLPQYLHVIEAALKDGKEYISGTIIAEELELEPIQVRKDLAITGIVGKPRIGFPVAKLIEAINRFLDWNNNHKAVVVGTGHLGTALLGYSEFPRHGMSILAAFDPDTTKIGKRINNIEVYAMDELSLRIKQLNIELAVITVPSHVAQDVADKVIAAGVRAIWNFTNVKLKVPKNIMVQGEDLSSGYAVLSVKMARMRSTVKD